MAKMTDDALLSILSSEIDQSSTWAGDTIRAEQIANLSYYLGLPMGDEKPGRSSVVSQDVFEIVESALPGFLEPFFSGDRIGEFKPRKPEDEAFCEQATDFVNYIIKDRNSGFLLMNTWFKDALLSKIGIVRAEWEDGESERRQWFGLSDDQMALLAQDERIQIIEHAARPMPGLPPMNEAQLLQMGGQLPMLHDVTVLEKQPGCVEIENVRPENFIVSRGAGNLHASKIVGEWVTLTRSELKEMGVKQYLDVTSYTDANDHDTMQSRRDGSTVMLAQGSEDDPSLEEVRLFKGYIKADYDGDGIAEWRRVLIGGGDDPVLENDEADSHNYAVLTPIPIPHRIIGMAYADPARQIQDIKTALTRQYLDSLYLANRPRTYINTEADISIDDLLTDRIGGFIRGRGPAQNAIQPIQTIAVSRDALEGLQMADGMREQRLGIPKINPGVEADALHKTATGTRSVNALVDKRQKMTLRVFAETGIKDLFKLVLRLVTKYQDQESAIRLRGEWVKVDPRQWNADLDCIVSVGVGTADETETMMMLQQFGAYMQWAATAGIVQPQNVYEFGKLLAKNARLQGADMKLLTDPSRAPPQQPQMPPEMIKAQAQMQVEQMKQQAAQQTDAARMQHEQSLEQARMAMQTQVDTHRQQVEAEQQALKAAADRELEQFKAQLQMQIEAQKIEAERWKAQLAAETQVTIEQMKLGAGPEAIAQSGEMQQVVLSAMEGLRMAVERMREPRQIVRGPDGKVQAVI